MSKLTKVFSIATGSLLFGANVNAGYNWGPAAGVGIRALLRTEWGRRIITAVFVVVLIIGAVYGMVVFIQYLARQMGKKPASDTAPAGNNACCNCGNPYAPGTRFCADCGASAGTATRCGKCSSPVEPGAQFCGNCGSAIEDGSVGDGAGDEADMVVCSNCGEPLGHDERYCGNCGSRNKPI